FSSVHSPARSQGALHSGARSRTRSDPDQSLPKRYDPYTFFSYSRSESHTRSVAPHTRSTYAPRSAPGQYADRLWWDALATGPPAQLRQWPPASTAYWL